MRSRRSFAGNQPARNCAVFGFLVLIVLATAQGAFLVAALLFLDWEPWT